MNNALIFSGQPGDQVYRDTDDQDPITSGEEAGNPGREVDDTVISDGKVLNVPTAIVARARLVHQAPWWHC